MINIKNASVVHSNIFLQHLSKMPFLAKGKQVYIHCSAEKNDCV